MESDLHSIINSKKELFDWIFILYSLLLLNSDVDPDELYDNFARPKIKVFNQFNVDYNIQYYGMLENITRICYRLALNG